ncbi:MAG: hypothetical protein FWC71_03410 [Defluviitaleaceae bacterium]|nr:hypothetical protein [Defluviitaleaceae bacterium]
MISQSDRVILRELAKQQQEYAHLPIMQKREEMWHNHNALIGNDVPIHFEVGPFSHELTPPLKTTSDFARNIEWNIYGNMLNHLFVDDDRVVPKTYDIAWHTRFVLFGIEVSRHHGEGLAFLYNHVIKDLRDDFHKLGAPIISLDKESTLNEKAMVEDIIGDILPTRVVNGYAYAASATQEIVKLMGMEAMYVALFDYPELVLQMMERLTDAHVEYFRLIKQENIPNNGNDWVWQGSFGFHPDNVLWGYADSQETEGISAEAYAEFFFPSYQRIAAEFDLFSYACCEPVHRIWEPCLRKLNNLRKLSISNWCDEAFMGEALRGTQTIYFRKPGPNFVGVGKTLDEDAFAKHIQKSLTAARGCKLEIAFRDVLTTVGDMTKPRRAVQITRNQIEKHWGK